VAGSDYRGKLDLPKGTAPARNHNTWSAARHGQHWYKFHRRVETHVGLHGTRATSGLYLLALRLTGCDPSLPCSANSDNAILGIVRLGLSRFIRPWCRRTSRGDESLERAFVGKPGMRVEELQLVGGMLVHEHCHILPRN